MCVRKHSSDTGGVVDCRVVERVNQALNEPSGQCSWAFQRISDQRGQRASLTGKTRSSHPQGHLHRVVVTHLLCLQRDGVTVKASVLFLPQTINHWLITCQSLMEAQMAYRCKAGKRRGR